MYQIHFFREYALLAPNSVKIKDDVDDYLLALKVRANH